MAKFLNKASAAKGGNMSALAPIARGVLAMLGGLTGRHL